MANKKVSALDPAVSVDAADTLYIVQGGTSMKATASLLPVSTPQQTALDLKADALTPVALTGATTLVRATHGNRQITFTGANANLTIDDDAGGLWSAGDSVEVVTLAGSAGVPTLITPDSKSIVGAIGKVIGAVRKGVDSWEVGTSDPKVYETIVIAASDETTALTTGTAKATFRMPFAMTLTAVRGSVTTAATGATLLTVDINESGTTIISTKLTFDASEKTTTTAATPAVISDASLADDAEITIDIDAVGNTIAGAGLKVYLIGYRT